LNHSLVITNTTNIFADYRVHVRASTKSVRKDSIIARISIVLPTNYPPHFSQELEEIKIEVGSKSFNYTLPQIIDYNNHEVDIDVTELPQFVKFDSEGKNLTFEEV
jgi:hypothetical protein